MDGICHTDLLLNRLAHLRMNTFLSDMVFVVAGEKIPAHRVILAASSEYFRALLFGGMAESHQKEITLDVPLEPFKLILNYIYTGQIPDECLSEGNIAQVLDLAHHYVLRELQQAMTSHLMDKLSVENALWTRHFAELYSIGQLLVACGIVIDQNAEQILQQKSSFNALMRDSLNSIIQRSSFHAKEIKIFLAVKEWYEHNPNENVQAVLSNVRLCLIDKNDLVNIVRPTSLVNEKLIERAIRIQRNKRNNLPVRHFERLEMESHFVPSGATYVLQHLFVANCIKAKLRSGETYSYYLEVSTDKRDWTRVIDYNHYKCSSYQNLRFPSMLVRFIRFVKNESGFDEYFAVEELQVMRTVELTNMKRQIIAPTYNVFLSNMGASIEQPYHSMDNLDFNTGGIPLVYYTGSFIVRLGQPYYVSSLRLRFSRVLSSGYCIKLSTNGIVWTSVVEVPSTHKTWRHFTFRPRILLYIRLDNERPEVYLSCELQCPSQDPTYLIDQKSSLLKCKPL